MVEDECNSNMTGSDDHEERDKWNNQQRDSWDRSTYDDDHRRSDDGAYDSDQDQDEAESQPPETIALFGVDGRTGHHFLRLALDAGYRVRALVPPSTKLEGDFDDLYTVIGTLNEDDKLQEVLYSSTYVVSMVGESILAKSGDYTRDCLLKFTKTLYRIMERQDEPPIQGFLFQSTALAANQWGELPHLARIIRTYWTRRRTLKYIDDLDAVTRFVHSKSCGSKQVAFPYIITRPTSRLREGRSTKKLQASKSVRG